MPNKTAIQIHAVHYSLELDTDMDVINVILTKLVFPPDVRHIEK